MKLFKSIKYQVLLLMSGIFLLIISLSFFAYQQFSSILIQLSQTSKPDTNVLYSRDVVRNITILENAMKSFTLTRDSAYINQYNTAKNETIGLFQEMTSHKNKTQSKIIDSLHLFVDSKFSIYEELLQIENEFRVLETVRQIDKQLELNGIKEKSIVDRFEPLKAITEFSGKAKKYDEIRDKLQQITSEETKKENTLIKREMELLELDKSVTSLIQNKINLLENLEKTRLNKKSFESSRIIKKVKTYLAVTSIFIVLLLLIMALSLLNYYRRNQEYKEFLKSAKTQAENFARSKEIFAANISHELRTPLHILIGYSDKLANEPLSEQQSEHMKVIRNTSNHLMEVINEVLDFTKLENNKLTLNAIGFKLRDLLSETEQLILTLIQKKELTFTLRFSDKCPEVLIGDSFRLRQILLNILSNAIKFTEKGKIDVFIDSIKHSDEKVILKIDINDTGIGIPPEKLDIIFNEFEQSDTLISWKYGGSGLGLAITKKLVELHNGHISITSEEKIGTSCMIEIPYIIGSENDIPKEQFKDFKTLDMSTVSVLIVDDEEYNRKIVNEILSKYNAIITEATNGFEAIQLAKSKNYDLILMDVRMPEVDGFQASKEIIEIYNSRGYSTSIIALTASIPNDESEKYKIYGIENILIKPFVENDLIGKIASILKVHLPNVFANNKNIEPEHNDNKLIDFNGLRKISDSKKEVYIEILETFVKSSRSGIRELKLALENNNPSKISHLTHKLKAPVRHLKSIQLFGMLQELEDLTTQNKNSSEWKNLIDKIDAQFDIIIPLIMTEIDLQKKE